MNADVKQFLKAMGYRVERVAIGWQAYTASGRPLFSHPKILSAAWSGVLKDYISTYK